MINEIYPSPLHPSNFLPEWQQSNEGELEQKVSPVSLTESSQNTPFGKRKRKNSEAEKQKNCWA